MNNLERYLDQVIDQKPATFDKPPGPVPIPEPGSAPQPSVLVGVLRRWYIVLVLFVLGCGAGLPAIWLLVKPTYAVSGAIRVAPVLQNVLTGRSDQGEISSYQEYVKTQAWMITSSWVVERVADDLTDRDLPFFQREPTEFVEKLVQKLKGRKGGTDPAMKLRRAISDGVIAAMPLRQTELIRVTMKSPESEQAEQIVNSFIRNYMALFVDDSQKEEDKNITLLESERELLTQKLQRARKEIRQLSEVYGTVVLDGQQEMRIGRQNTLLGELTRLEARRISLEAGLELLQQAEPNEVSPELLVGARNEYINSDPVVQELSKSLVQMERDLIVAKQSMPASNPRLKQRQELLDALKSSMESRREELGKGFDEGLAERIQRSSEERLKFTKATIEQIKVQEKHLRQALNIEDQQTREIGRTSLDIQDLQFQLELDKEIYDTICRRLREAEMERKREARITAVGPAEVGPIQDERLKYSAVLTFGVLGCGVMLAFLRDKVDKRLQTPDDVTRHIGIPIIGTTTSSHTIKPALFAEQIAGDYQTIRANLGLLDNGGMPRKLAVTSPGVREGKTTFAINLATSMAKSGKKVLLIDGDIRKPDVAHMLSVPNGSGSLQDVLMGKDPAKIIRTIASTGLDVLVADPRRAAEVYDLLTSAGAVDRINKLSQQYDHVIIDTPPTLVFPDVLVWAKIADGVILVSFAGQTTAPELQEAKERLKRVRARVLGTVLSNVRADQGYYSYGYSHYARSGQLVRKAGKFKKKLLLPVETRDEEAAD